MYFNLLELGLQNYILGNIIDDNGYVTTKHNKDFKIVLPPKNIKSYNSLEEYNKAVDEYNKFKEQCQVFYTAISKTVDYALNPDETLLFSKKDIKKIISQTNKVIKNNEDEELDAVPFKENIDLTSKEIETRKINHNEAVKTLTKGEALFKIGSSLITEYVNKRRGLQEDTREAQILFLAGVKDMDQLFREYDILVNGTPEDRAKMFEQKYEIMKNCALEMAEQKTPENYNKFFKDNFLTVFGLGDLEPGKINKVEKQLNFKYSENTHQDLKENYNSYVAAGSEHRILAGMANPYYTVIKENSYKVQENARFADQIISHEQQEEQYELFERFYNEKQNTTSKIDEAINEHRPMLSYLNGYMQNQGFGKKERLFTKDFVKLYFLKNKDNITKIVDEKGQVYQGDYKELAQKANEQILQNKGVLLYDKNGNLISKMQVIDNDMCDIPTTYKDGFGNIYIDSNRPQLTIKALKAEIKKLDSFFSHDHQEYIDIKEYINKMDKAMEKGHTMNELCVNLRTLATKYLEPKYTKDTPEKTERTYDREAFMCKLIATIDHKYPITYAKKVSTKKISNIDNPSKEEKQFMQDIIAMNKEGYSRNEVENFIDEKIKVVGEDTSNREPIEVNINEDIDLKNIKIDEEKQNNAIQKEDVIGK